MMTTIKAYRRPHRLSSSVYLEELGRPVAWLVLKMNLISFETGNQSPPSARSCLSAKLRAMSHRYLAKLYRPSGSSSNEEPSTKRDNPRRTKLRSFSYGALPGLGTDGPHRQNPLYREDDDEDAILASRDSGHEVLIIDLIYEYKI